METLVMGGWMVMDLIYGQMALATLGLFSLIRYPAMESLSGEFTRIDKISGLMDGIQDRLIKGSDMGRELFKPVKFYMKGTGRMGKYTDTELCILIHQRLFIIKENGAMERRMEQESCFINQEILMKVSGLIIAIMVKDR